MQTNCEANIFAMKCFPTNWQLFLLLINQWHSLDGKVICKIFLLNNYLFSIS